MVSDQPKWQRARYIAHSDIEVWVRTAEPEVRLIEGEYAPAHARSLEACFRGSLESSDGNPYAVPLRSIELLPMFSNDEIPSEPQ